MSFVGSAVWLSIGEVEITLSGLPVIRNPHGGIEVRAATYRSTTGEFAAAFQLPPQLGEQIGLEIIEKLRTLPCGDLPEGTEATPLVRIPSLYAAKQPQRFNIQ